MSSDTEFLRAILDAPEDACARLVYADWLEERGDLRGEYLRLDTAFVKMPRRAKEHRRIHDRLIELRKTLDREWVTAVSRSPHDIIKHMHVTIYPKSPGSWRTQEIKAPSWTQVEQAIRRLDRY